MDTPTKRGPARLSTYRAKRDFSRTPEPSGYPEDHLESVKTGRTNDDVAKAAG